jgi:hypothetical protein
MISRNCATRPNARSRAKASGPPLDRRLTIHGGNMPRNAVRATERVWPNALQCHDGMARQVSTTGWASKGESKAGASARSKPST